MYCCFYDIVNVCSNSLWHVLWQKWSEITKCITLLWVNGNILQTGNKSFMYFLNFFGCFILSYQWLNGYEEKYLFSFARIMIYFPPQQSVIFEHSFYCRIFLNVFTFFLCVCHYFSGVVKVSWQSESFKSKYKLSHIFVMYVQSNTKWIFNN